VQRLPEFRERYQSCSIRFLETIGDRSILLKWGNACVGLPGTMAHANLVMNLVQYNHEWITIYKSGVAGTWPQ
jgi:hypothetical protein